jgi:hypothetical protein
VIAFRGGSGDWFDAGISGSGFQAFPGSKIDFQVEAMNGDVTQIISNPLPDYVWTGEKSGWSSTKTLTMPTYSDEAPNQPDLTPNQTSSDQTGAVIVGFSLPDWYCDGIIHHNSGVNYHTSI